VTQFSPVGNQRINPKMGIIVGIPMYARFLYILSLSRGIYINLDVHPVYINLSLLNSNVNVFIVFTLCARRSTRCKLVPVDRCLVVSNISLMCSHLLI
jgi:hypothetical protein